MFICLLLVAFVLGMRIIAGGHFLSDVVFSQIVVTAVIFASYLVYKKISNE